MTVGIIWEHRPCPSSPHEDAIERVEITDAGPFALDKYISSSIERQSSPTARHEFHREGSCESHLPASVHRAGGHRVGDRGVGIACLRDCRCRRWRGVGDRAGDQDGRLYRDRAGGGRLRRPPAAQGPAGGDGSCARRRRAGPALRRSGAILGMPAASALLAAIAAIGLIAGLWKWPAVDTEAVDHAHSDLPAGHPHLAGHAPGPHRHPYVIDDLHVGWPGRD